MRIAVLASGSGTIFDAVCEAGVPVVGLVVDRVCPALDIAKTHAVPATLVDRAAFGWPTNFDRPRFTKSIAQALQAFDADLVAMAGFMTVLEAEIFNQYPDRVVNTHPSLLPLYPGARAVDDALAAGATETGCTVHTATLSVDSGPILAQERVDIEPADTSASLHERIKEVERRLYPRVLLELVEKWKLT